MSRASVSTADSHDADAAAALALRTLARRNAQTLSRLRTSACAKPPVKETSRSKHVHGAYSNCSTSLFRRWAEVLNRLRSVYSHKGEGRALGKDEPIGTGSASGAAWATNAEWSAAAKNCWWNGLSFEYRRPSPSRRCRQSCSAALSAGWSRVT